MGAGLIATAAVAGTLPSSAEAASLAARQPGLTTTFTPERNVHALDCSLVGFDLPPSLDGPVRANLSLNVARVFTNFRDGQEVGDMTSALVAGQAMDLLRNDGSIEETISNVPATTIDYALVRASVTNPAALNLEVSQHPVVESTFLVNQIDTHADQIQRFNKSDGSHEWRSVSEVVGFSVDKADSVKKILDRCGQEVWRRVAQVKPWQVVKGGILTASGDVIDLVDRCLATVSLIHERYVSTKRPPVVPPAVPTPRRDIPMPINLPSTGDGSTELDPRPGTPRWPGH